MAAKDLTCECGQLTSAKCPTCGVNPLCGDCESMDSECAQCALESDFEDDDDAEDDDDDDDDADDDDAGGDV